MHSSHEIGAITNIALKFNILVSSYKEFNSLGSLKSIAYVKEQWESVRSIST